MLIEGADYFVREMEFPEDNGGVHGMVLLNSDGTYSVYVDKNATDEQKKIALEHELEHIESDDLHGEKSVKEIEGNLGSEKIDEVSEYFRSWLDWMEWCRREMRKKGIKPMEL